MNPVQLPTAAVPMLTPCIGICTLDAEGRCEGCLRTGAEIAAWSSLSEQQRQWYLDEELPRREALLGA